jgi:ferric-dicitrate binding protein FerR (iron transport regulator)
MKQELDQENDLLLLKILNGTATSEEIHEFSVWLKDYRNEEYFDKFKDMWHVSVDSIYITNRKVTGETGRFTGYIRKSVRKERLVKRYRVASVAASVVLLIGISWATGIINFKHSVNTDFSTLIYSQDSVKVALNNGEIIKTLKESGKSLTTIGRESVAEVVPAKQSDAAKTYNTVTTPPGERVLMVLSDGTKVYLTSNSYLRYPNGFDNNKREVTITGRAYFEVKKSKVPFIVNTQDMKVEVLGTSFDVESKNTGDNASVILVEGSVKVSAEGKTTIIHPDEQMNLSRQTKEMTIKTVDSRLLTMWKDGVLIVHGQSFKELIESVSSWYGVNIVDKSSVPRDDKFNGRFDREDIEAAIKAICISAKTKYRIEDGKLILEDI